MSELFILLDVAHIAQALGHDIAGRRRYVDPYSLPPKILSRNQGRPTAAKDI